MKKEIIPFNKPFMTGDEINYIKDAYESGHLSSSGKYSKLCADWLKNKFNVREVLICHSCTAALEIAALLANVSPGDEVILPSYTFVSTANSFALRGAKLRFVDVDEDTLCLDNKEVLKAINKNTKVIVTVHYAGNSGNIEELSKITKKNKILLVEDCAQSILSKYKNKYLGTYGDLATLSFHETKNIICGEGGALLINNKKFIERAQIILEKGTNRKNFINGLVDKYTWKDIGSSYAPGEINSAFLWAQLQSSDMINNERMKIWNRYHNLFDRFEISGLLKRPKLNKDNQHNAHMYYILFNESKFRDIFIQKLLKKNIQSVFHYVPLHSSDFGKNYGSLNLVNTDFISKSIVRLPLWIGLYSKMTYLEKSIINVLKELDNLKNKI